MRNSNYALFTILVFIFLILPCIYAFNTTSVSYAVESWHNGLAGGAGTTSSYSFKSTLTYEQPGHLNFTTTSFEANSGWFVTSQTVGPAIVSVIQCHNGTQYKSCTELGYGENITKIRANCVAIFGSVTNVTFDLYNIPDDTHYINNQSYSSTSDDYYIYEEPYVLTDSGDWNLTVTCYAINYSLRNESWDLPWGQLNATLITPATNANRTKNQFFVFQSKVECVGGECGQVQATLDPHEVSVSEKNIFRTILDGMKNVLSTLFKGSIVGYVIYDNSTNETENNDTINDTIIPELNETLNITDNYTTENMTVDINETINASINETSINDTPINTTNATINATDLNLTNNLTNISINESIINDTIINETLVNESLINNTITNTTNQSFINATVNETITPINNTQNLTTINQSLSIDNRTLILTGAQSSSGIVKLDNDAQVLEHALIMPQDSGYSTMTAESEFEFTTPLLAVYMNQSVSATVFIPKLSAGDITVIKKCDIWNFNDNRCDSIWYDYDSIIEQNNSYIWFNVSSFSAYGGGIISQNQTGYLLIWDSSDIDMPFGDTVKYENDTVRFYANYTSTRNGTPISFGDCKISFSGSAYDMTYNSSIQAFTYNRSFSTHGTYTFNVTCNSTQFSTVSAVDTITIATTEKTGAVSTTEGDVPFYTNSTNPIDCGDMDGGDECITTWYVNSTGANSSTHTFYVDYNLSTNTGFVSDASTDQINITIGSSDTTPPIWLSRIITPPIGYLGENATIFMTAFDDVAIRECHASITTPGSTTYNRVGICSSPKTIELNETGTFVIRFIATDTSSNTNDTTVLFDVTNPLMFTVETNSSNGSLQADMTIKYPETNDTIHSNTTNGSYSVQLPDSSYNIEFDAYDSNIMVVLEGINVTQETGKMFGIDKLTTPSDGYLATYGIKNNYQISGSSIRIYYNDLDYESEPALELYKCDNWSFYNQSCNSTWYEVTPNSTQNTIENFFELRLNSFSGFSIRQGPYCGDGYCNASQGETCSTCTIDCGACVVPDVPSSGGGGGGGGGGGASSSTTGEVNFELIKIDTELYEGEREYHELTIENTYRKRDNLSIRIDEDLSGIISVPTRIELQPESTASIKVTVKGSSIGTYMGNIYITGNVIDVNQTIPVKVKVLPKESEEIIFLELEAKENDISVNETLEYKVRIINYGDIDSYDLEINYTLVSLNNETIMNDFDMKTLEKTLSMSKRYVIPEDLSTGGYLLKAVASYKGIELSSDTINITIIEPAGIIEPEKQTPGLFESGLFSLVTTQYLLIGAIALFLLIFIIIMGYYIGHVRKKLFQKKIEEIKKKSNYPFPDFDDLPKEHFAYVGMVADAHVNAYLDHTQLNLHTLIAGGTGSGKTMSGMVMVEEVLKKKLPVVVFDPVGQWTGFTKKNTDKKMRSLYHRFGMKKPEEFKTDIIEINKDNMNIDIIEYIHRKGLTVFLINKLPPAQADLFIDMCLEKIYRKNMHETTSLKALLILDEVHRLLPKYGGRKAYIRLEQAVREFRKWGVGLLMISQVLTDFKGAIRGNIGTMIQMRTRYEGDIKRVRERHGSLFSKLVSKVPTGVGLVESSGYNRGHPYFIEFRPLLHSQLKLTPEDIAKHVKVQKVVLGGEDLLKDTLKRNVAVNQLKGLKTEDGKTIKIKEVKTEVKPKVHVRKPVPKTKPSSTKQKTVKKKAVVKKAAKKTPVKKAKPAVKKKIKKK